MTSPKPESAIDRDQRKALVSLLPFSYIWTNVWERWRVANSAFSFAATHPRFPQSPHELRCFAVELPLDYLRYHSAGEKELDDINPEWRVLRRRNTSRSVADGRP